MKCPANHELPHGTPNGECTPVYCSEQKFDTEETGLTVAEEAESPDEAADIEKALAREKARLKALKIPKGLKGGDAEAFVTEKMTELSVLAVADLEGQLRFGNDRARAAARREVLQATGHGPKEGAVGGGALIVIQAGDGSVSTLPPWKRKRPRQIASTQVVDANVKDAESNGD